MVFLTYNDLPSGIFYSQVTDTCNFLNTELKTNIRLISIISLRNFFENKRKIKSQFPSAIVLPMFPKLRNWKLNFLLLYFIFLFRRTEKIIARNVFACLLAINLKNAGLVKWVCYDGRGAVAAEENEYSVSNDADIRNEIFNLEKTSVLDSDFRIAVSSELVKYWKDSFSYRQDKHVVIPCTLHSGFLKKIPDESRIKENREKMKISGSDIVIVYSGSSAGWQSLTMADDFLFHQMENNSNVRVLFLIKEMPAGMNIMNKFKERVMIKWLKEENVRDALACCDYGLLLREKSTTNKVASPVKFAEYLASGLKIIISDGIGDSSDFVRKNDCGFILDSIAIPVLYPLQFTEKQKLSELAGRFYSKNSFKEEYKKLI